MKRDRVIFAIDVGGNENATLQLSIRRKKKIERKRKRRGVYNPRITSKKICKFLPISLFSPSSPTLSLSKNKWMSRMYDRWEEDVSRKNQSLSKIWIEEEKLERGSRAGENESIASADRSGGGGRESGVSFCRRFIRKWRCETRIKCYSSSVSRWIRGSSPTGARDKSMLPQSPGRVSLLVDRSPFTERGWGTTEISSNGSNGMLFEGILWGGGGEEGKKCRETAASP